MEQHPTRPSVASVIAEVWLSGFALELGREETAFVAGIHAYLQHSAVLCLDEQTLRAIYSQVFELANAGTDSEAQRATHIIGRLVNQGVLVRVDSGGWSYEGEYVLTPLGMALAEGMQNERALTKRNLAFLLMRMRGELAQILAAASEGGPPEHWEMKVMFPMRDVMVEMMTTVEKRQLGLDAEHKLLRQHITALFDSEWLTAADSCKQMVSSVDQTLAELNAVLCEHVESLQRQLLSLSDLAAALPALAAVVERAQNQLLRLAAWGARRHEDWAQYYRNVQVHIRYFVQTDPDNRLRGRLVEQIRRFQDRPFGLALVGPEPFRHLREVLKPDLPMALEVPEELLAGQGLRDGSAIEPGRVDLARATLIEQLCSDGDIDMVVAAHEIAPDFTDQEHFSLLVTATPELLKFGMTDGKLVRQEWIVVSARVEAQTLKLVLRRQLQRSPALPVAPPPKKEP
jgi:chromosome condensin MukBEF complex kleisin-like MukF subunit